MITQQDLKILERLYTPLARILLEHLRMDHGYGNIGNKLLELQEENKELISELTSLRTDYNELQKLFMGGPR